MASQVEFGRTNDVRFDANGPLPPFGWLAAHVRFAEHDSIVVRQRYRLVSGTLCRAVLPGSG